jgi:hypothetical protein
MVGAETGAEIGVGAEVGVEVTHPFPQNRELVEQQLSGHMTA